MPSIDTAGRRLTVEAALANPTTIRHRIAQLVARRTIASAFVNASGEKVQGGGILHSVIRPEDLYSSDVEDRAPGNEYKSVVVNEPTFDLAKLQDFGGFYEVTDEERDRNIQDVVDERTTALSNTILRTLDRRVLAAVDAAVAAVPDGGGTIPGVDVTAIERNGDPASQTATAQRFEAVLAAVNLAAEVDEMGLEFTDLVMSPADRSALALAYSSDLPGVLEAFGFERITSSPLVTAGTAYAVAPGQAGRIGYERPLTVEVIPARERRTTRIQAYLVPAVAVTNPYAIKRITGLQGA